MKRLDRHGMPLDYASYIAMVYGEPTVNRDSAMAWIGPLIWVWVLVLIALIQGGQ